MKIQVRQGCFETNSSSTHAICIGNDYNIVPATRDDVYTFLASEFGWEADTYTGNDIANYLYTLAREFDDEQRFVDVVTQYMKDAGYDNVDFVESSFYYVDHCWNASEFYNWAIESKENFYKCIFGSSAIYTGNDNGESVHAVKDMFDKWEGIKFYKGN